MQRAAERVAASRAKPATIRPGSAKTLVNAYPFTASHSVDHAQTPDSSPALSQRHCARSRTRFPPGQALAVAVLGLAGVAAFGITPDTSLDAIPVRSVSRTLPLPAIAVDDEPADQYWREERVQRGDTIGSLLARATVVDPDAMEFLRTDPSARALYQLRPGRAIRVATDDDGRLAGLRFLASNGEILSIGRSESGFSAQRQTPPEDTRLTMRAGEIASSLFAAADEAGLPDTITLALADVFGGDIDFYHDLRRGDRFIVLYETRYVDGEPAGTGRIVAAEFVNRGVALHAFLWRAPDGDRGLLRRDGAQFPQGIPALADGVLPHHIGLHAGALPSDPALDARA